MVDPMRTTSKELDRHVDKAIHVFDVRNLVGPSCMRQRFPGLVSPLLWTRAQRFTA